MSDELTVEDLKGALTPQDYQTLTFADEQIAVRCLLRAKMVVKGMILSTGHVYDENDELCRMCVLKRGRVELYLFNGQHQIADQEQGDLDVVIRTNYGPVITKNDTGDSGGAPVGMIARPLHSPLDDAYGR